MPMVRRGDDYGVDGFVGQQVVMGAISLRPASGAIDGPLDAARVSIHDTHDFSVGISHNGLHELMRACAGTDVAHRNALVGSGLDDLPGGQRGAGLKETAAVEIHGWVHYTILGARSSMPAIIL